MIRIIKYCWIGLALGIMTSGMAWSRSEEQTGLDSVLDVLLWGQAGLVGEVTDFENLSLENCLRIGIVHNLSIQNQRDSLRSTKEDLRGAENFFDFQGTLSLEHRQDVHTPVVEQGTSLVFDPVRQENVPTTAESSVLDDDVTSLNLQLTKQIKTGAVLSLQPSLRESDFQKNQWSTGLVATIRQPLLDGFGYKVSTADLRSSRLGVRQGENLLDGAVRSLVVDIVQDYYSVIKSQMILEERQKALKRSNEQLRAAKIRREEGEVAELDVLQANLQVKSNENSLISAGGQLQDQLVNFRLRLGIPHDIKIGVEKVKAGFVPKELDSEQLEQYALVHRIDLKNEEINLERSRLALLKAKNRKMPNLDLTGTYSFVDGNDDFDQVYDLQQGSMEVGIVFSMPLGNVSDDVGYKKSRLALRQAEINLEERRRQALAETNSAVRRAHTLENQIEILMKNVEIAQETFRLSKLSYEVGGLISAFDLSSSQDDLTSARTEYVTALFDYKIALARLELTQGLDLISLIKSQVGGMIQ